MAELPADAPAGLREALADRNASVERARRLHRRVYVHAQSGAGRLFARYSLDPRDVPFFVHEAAVRRIVGVDGPLRAPNVLARGESWLLEPEIAHRPGAGRVYVETVAAAAERLAALQLPVPPHWRITGGSGARLRRTAVLARSPLPLADLWRSKRLREESRLPQVTSHGDFHRENVLFADDAAWVVDWELSGRRPFGYDLMQHWATLSDPSDREALFEAAVALAGEVQRGELLRLRYALVVTTLANYLASPMPFDRDPEEAHTLLQLLPDVRAEAGLR